MDKEQNEGQNVKNALAFIPLLAFVFYFIDKDRTERFNRNLGYSVILIVFYIVFVVFFGFVSVFLVSLIVLFYLGFSFFLGFKAYSGEDIEIKFFDDILDKFKENSGK